MPNIIAGNTYLIYHLFLIYGGKGDAMGKICIPVYDKEGKLLYNHEGPLYDKDWESLHNYNGPLADTLNIIKGINEIHPFFWEYPTWRKLKLVEEYDEMGFPYPVFREVS